MSNALPICQHACQSVNDAPAVCGAAVPGWPRAEVAWIVHYVPGQRYPDGGHIVGRYGASCRAGAWQALVNGTYGDGPGR